MGLCLQLGHLPRPRYEPALPLSAHLWASFSTSQSLGFLICEMENDNGTSLMGLQEDLMR